MEKDLAMLKVGETHSFGVVLTQEPEVLAIPKWRNKFPRFKRKGTTFFTLSWAGVAIFPFGRPLPVINDQSLKYDVY